jgi:cytochrome P450
MGLKWTGGDTTSTALAAVLFYLSRYPSCHSKLVAEVRSTFTRTSQIRRGNQLSSCSYLRACIDEALRLAPAAPGALWRQACEGGAFVDGEYIPEGLDIGTCTYALSHSGRYFDEPFAFKPERFMAKHTAQSMTEKYPFTSQTTVSTDPSFLPASDSASQRLANDLDAFAPFSVGPRSCLAKPLAYLELTLALAHMIWLLDFEVVDSTGEGRPELGRGRERKEEFQITDMFSSNKQGPLLRFRRRF